MSSLPNQNTCLEEVFIKPLIWEDASKPNEEDLVPIRVWGHDRKGNSVCLRIEDFPNFYWIELPKEIQGQRIQWTENLAHSTITQIAERAHNFDPDWIITTSFPQNGQETLYYYKLDPCIPMVRVYFKSMHAGNMFARKLNYDQHILDFGKAKLIVHENSTKIPITLKLRSLLRLMPCQWIKVDASYIEPKNSISTSKEYIVKWNKIVGIPPSQTTDWDYNPVLMAVDGEMYSDNPKAMPDKHVPKHCCFMWSCVVKRYKAAIETTKRYCIVLGDCDQIPAEKLSNSEIINVDTEIELMNKYAELCQKEDPDIILGFNIYGFDNPYLNFRVARNLQDLPIMGRIKGEKSTYKEQQWESRAYNEMPINFFIMPGRIMLDLLTYFKRGSQKFQQYKLDTIAHHYLGETKNDMSPQNMFRIYGEYLKLQTLKLTDKNRYEQLVEPVKVEMQEVALYCIQDSELLLKLTDYINLLTDITELANVVHVNPLNTVISGQTVRCVSQIYYLCSSIGIVINERTAELKTFKGGAVADPEPGQHDFVLCWDFASMYPSIMRAFNVDYTTLIPESIINKINSDCYQKVEFEQEEEDDTDEETAEAEFEVGAEFDDNGKEKKKKKSTKPKIIKKYVYYWYNKRKGVLPVLVENLVNERNAVRFEMGKDGKILKEFEKEDNILANLLAKTDATEEEIKLRDKLLAETEQRSQNIFRMKVRIGVNESRQLGLKVSGNSMYGFIGAKFGLPLQEGSRTVTAMGRALIGQITAYVIKYYQGTRIYGDTDSTMMTIPYITNSKQLHHWGTKIAEEVNHGIKPGGVDALGNVIPEGRSPLLADPMKIEYEKGMRIVCFKKKKYAALLYGKDGEIKTDDIKNEQGIVIGKKDQMLTRGIVLSRRDNCQYLRDTYYELLYDILHGADLISVYQKMFIKIHNILSGEVSLDQLKIVKSCRATYAKESNAMNIFVKNLKEDRKQVTPGDRLEYIIVIDPNFPGHDKVGYKKRSLEQYTERLGTPREEKIDYSWYVAKHLKNPIDQLLAVGYHKEITYLKNTYGRNFVINKRSKTPLHLDKPLTIISQILKEGHSHFYFANWFSAVIGDHNKAISNTAK